MALLFDVVSDALEFLDDTENAVWSRDEMGLYAKDGYDTFARRTKCIWDITILENTPPTGNYSSDLQKYNALQIPGEVITDKRMVFNSEDERDNVREPLEGLTVPTAITGPGQDSDGNIPGANPGGRLPSGTVDVIRVSWNRKTLLAETPEKLATYNPNYETTEGTPQFWTWRKDGLMGLRIVPVPSGDAIYDDISGGPFGFITQSSDTDLDVDLGGAGGYGILRATDGGFPSGGPHGTPTRTHPDANNTKVEVARLGRNPESYPFELPGAFVKYVTFYAMAQALRRDGPGQDLALSQHFMDRFESGVRRMITRLKRNIPTKVGTLGLGAKNKGTVSGFTLPAYWGVPR